MYKENIDYALKASKLILENKWIHIKTNKYDNKIYYSKDGNYLNYRCEGVINMNIKDA